jgi:hypothetical protein
MRAGLLPKRQLGKLTTKLASQKDLPGGQSNIDVALFRAGRRMVVLAEQTLLGRTRPHALRTCVIMTQLRREQSLAGARRSPGRVTLNRGWKEDSHRRLLRLAILSA